MKCLTPDPALPTCAIEFDDDEDRRITFRHAEDEGMEDADYYGTITVPEGSGDVEYIHLWNNTDVITRCEDEYQDTPQDLVLVPYEVGITISKNDVVTGDPVVLVDYSPLVVFDGNVTGTGYNQGIWNEDAGSEDYVAVIFENDNTNQTEAGPPKPAEFSFILTNQDGSVDEDGRPVVELSDSMYYWDTNGFSGDDWNDQDETAGHEAFRQSEALFPDQGYTVTAVAKDHRDSVTAYSRKVLIDNFAPIAERVLVTIEKNGGGIIDIYEAEWDEGDLEVVTRTAARPIQGDILRVDVYFSEAMRDEGIEIRLLGGEVIGNLLLTQESLESDTYENDHWTGRVTLTTWGAALRDQLSGKLFISIEAEDKAGNRLDCWPVTSARRTNPEGVWTGYEDENLNPGDSGGTDKKTHWFELSPWISQALLFDHSGSEYNYWASGAINIGHHLLDFMNAEHAASGRNDIYRASIYQYYAAPGSQDPSTYLLLNLTSDLSLAQGLMDTLYQLGPADFCSNQQYPLEEAMVDLKNAYCVPRRLVWISDLQVNSGPYVDTQVAAWIGAAADTTYGTNTVMYAVMQEDRRGVEPEMAGIINQTGGGCLTSPFGTLYNDPPIAEHLYHLIRDDAVLHQLTEEDPSGRTSYTFRVDPTMTSLFALGSWTDWGMQVAADEEWCWHTGGSACCGDESEPGDSIQVMNDGVADITSKMNEKDSSASRGDMKKPRQDHIRGGSRATFQLFDASATEILPTDTLGSNVFWKIDVDSSDAGEWTLTVSGEAPFSARMSGISPVRIENTGKKGVLAASTETIRVRVDGVELSSPDWAVVNEDGIIHDDAFELYDDGMHGDGAEDDNVWANSYTFPDSGAYRMRVQWSDGSYDYERTTASAIKVYHVPRFTFLNPDGVSDSTGSNFTIRWEDNADFSATFDLYYDGDNSGADGTLIMSGIEEDDPTDSLRWNVFGLSEGDYYLYAVIDDGMNPAQTVYSDHTVTVLAGFQDGWPKTVGGNVFASPVAVDLHADGSTLEVVVACEDSSVYVWDCYGNLLSGWPVDLVNKSNTTPAIGNIDTSDQELEIVVGAKDGSGTLYCLNHNGTAVSGWPITLGIPINSAATLVDLNGDGELEIIVACGDSLHVRESDGTVYPGWPQYTGYTSILFTSPCVADFDGDGYLEIAIAGYPSTLYMFEDDGTLAWDESLVSLIVYSPLSAGDLDWDGLPELVVQDFGSPGSRLYAFNGDGTSPAGWETPIQVGLQARSGASLGDIDGDGRLEVFIGDGNIGYVYGYSSDGNPLPGDWGSGIQVAAQVYAPIGIADIDGDGEDEIIALGNTIDKMYVLETDGTLIDAWCRSLDGDIYAAPCIADIDLDGDPEILIGTNVGTVYCYDFGGSHDPLRFDYPKFQGDLHNTGLNQDLITPVSPELLSVEKVEPDSLRLKWNTVRTDMYDRDEYVKKYLIYRGDEPYGDDWSTLAGEVEAPDTTFTHRSGTVGDTNTDVYYRVKAEDMHGNRSELSDEAYGEKEFGTNGSGKKKTEEREER